MPIKLKNNARDFLASAITDADTSITLQSGDTFPELASGEYFYATIQDTAGQLEIVKVTGKFGSVLSVTRGQEGTGTFAFPAGSRFELRVTVASIEGGGFTADGANAVSRTIQNKLRDVVSVKDFGAVGDGSTDDIEAFEAAIAVSSNVYMPAGTYAISRPIIIQAEKFRLFGATPSGPGEVGATGGTTTIRPLAGFSSATLGGQTASPAIWYQRQGTWTEDNWIEGGCFENFQIRCDRAPCEGVRINRVTSGHVFRNLRITEATIGIHGTKWGWQTKFDNLHIVGSTVSAIKLTNAYNACTFTNCALYGGSIDTPVLLDMQLDCYGNSWTGGYIEGGDIGVKLVNAQLAIHGADFEIIRDKFIEITGLYGGSPPTLNFANPTVSIVGCTFVGAPSVVGIEVTGGAADVQGNFFITGSAPGAGVFILSGVATGDQTVSGFRAPCISEANNVTRGWGTTRLATGNVYSRIFGLYAGSTSVSKLLTGNTSTQLLSATAPQSAVLNGISKIPSVYGYGLNTDPTYVDILTIRALGDVDTGVADGEDEYVASNYNLDNARFVLQSNNQGGSPTATFGRAGMVASRTISGAKDRTRAVFIDSIAEGFIPGNDDGTSLGSAANRWSDVYAGNGTIITSDGNEKQQVRDLNSAEQAVATKIKSLIKTFKFNNAVEQKGEKARIHIGAIAQEVQQAFIQEGLDPDGYGMFCRDEWYAKDGDVMLPDENGKYPKGSEKITRLGLRYEELLAFVISAL